MSRRGAISIVASPVLVGAVTVLVATVAMILAYNANQGLPFIPQYVVNATIPGGANLVEGNEVRVGGFRVGLVDRIGPQVVKNSRGEYQSVAVIRMKLDKTVEELPLDTKVIVRPRSSLGLKYVQLTPGSSAKSFRPGATIPLKNAEGPVEFDDLLNTFQDDVRDNAQKATQGVGDALSGRGPSINEALVEFRPLLKHLSPVMRSLSDPRTEIDRFFREIGQTAADIARSCDDGSGPRRLPAGATRRFSSPEEAQSLACSNPVAVVQGRLFSEMADTFRAIGSDPAALRQTIEDTAPTNYSAIQSFRPQTPFFGDTAELMGKLEPAAEELPRSLPPINRALVVGQEVLPRTVRLNEELEDVFRALDQLAENPNTLLALRDLTQATRIGAPLVEYLAPYQTVCNYWTINWTNLGEHLSEPVDDGTLQRVMAKFGPPPVFQDDTVADSNADRWADVPANMDPQDAHVGDTEQFEEFEDELEDRIDEAQELLDDLEDLDGGTAAQDLPPAIRDPLIALLGSIPDTMIISGLIDAVNELIDRLQEQLDALRDMAGVDLTSYHNQFYQPAIDGQGNADCQSGQNGFPDRLITTGRYPPSNDPEKNGGSHVVMDPNTPGLAGTTYWGIERLQDVDDEQRSRHPKGEVPENRPQKPNPQGLIPGDPDPLSGGR
jgi:virulence factor Mce-like protein